MTEQTVVETDAMAEPIVDDNSAPDLEALLSEYEQETQVEQQPTEPDPVDPDRLNQVLTFVESQQKEVLTKQVNADIQSSVETIKEGMEIPLPDKIVRGYLETMAAEDDRIAQAFQQRDKNPAGWTNVLKAVQKEISKEFESLPDQKLTSDREAVAAAVRSAATKTQPTDDFDASKVRSMSMGDLAKQFPELNRNF